MNKQTMARLCMKYYQVIKRDKLLIHTATEMNLIYIILNFKKPARNNYVHLYFCEILENAKLGVEKRWLITSLRDCDYGIVKGNFFGGSYCSVTWLCWWLYNYALSKLIPQYT